MTGARRAPTRASLRRVIDQVLGGDADLDAFCLDYFAEVHRQFAAGMQRKAKITLLLSAVAPAEVLAALTEEHGETVSRHEALEWEEELFAGAYRLLRQIGRGGMGTVFEAEHVKTGQRRALKRMHVQFVQDPEKVRRFVQEAKISAGIQSKHVVEVLDAGVDEHDMPWLAMELLEGEDLGAYLQRRGALPLPEVRAVLAQICHALGAAHEQGIVHRDLKPENLFLARSLLAEGPDHLVKVLDFGIARLVGESQSLGTLRLGSPIWMAPEQTELATITPAADVWALGLLAFRMLCGHHYLLSAERKGPEQAVIREIVLDELVPASRRAMEHSCSGRLPAGFDGWFGRCVVRDPAARFADAGAAYRAFAEEVGRVPAGRGLGEGGGAAADPHPNPLPQAGEGVLSGNPWPQDNGSLLRPKMILIRPGAFLMGSPPDEPGRGAGEIQHPVCITVRFSLSDTLITQEQYQHVMGVNPSRFKGRADLPVESVSWFDAVAYCNRLSRLEGLEECYQVRGTEVTWPRGLSCTGYRLPTEAEWEYAARAGETWIYAGSNRPDDIAWYGEYSKGNTHPVKGKRPNAWGLYDMSGNVMEWIWDWYGHYPSKEEADPIGPPGGSKRVHRGGSYWGPVAGLRVAFRCWIEPGTGGLNLGFRVARSLP